MKILVSICSKSPNDCLTECVGYWYGIQIANSKHSYKIVIVDSCSTDLSAYVEVKKYWPDIEILLINNKNYEFGAAKACYTLYPDYDIYVNTQDNLFIKQKVDFSTLDNNSVFYIPHHSGFKSFTYIDSVSIAKEYLKNTNFNFDDFLGAKFPIAMYNFYAAPCNIVEDIFCSFNCLPIDKNGSCLYERLLGMYFLWKKYSMTDLTASFEKRRLTITRK